PVLCDCRLRTRCLHSTTAPLCLFSPISCLFFFTDTPTTEIYTLSLHDALPIFFVAHDVADDGATAFLEHAKNFLEERSLRLGFQDRKSTRLNSSHQIISYAVFCLKKKKKKQSTQRTSRKKHRADSLMKQQPSCP